MKFDLCGRLSGQHVYVPFDVTKTAEEMVIDFKIGSNTYAIWDLEINQIECNEKASIVKPDERQAPDGCLQYFYNSTGRVQSFNFGLQQYFGNTNYAICFDRNNDDNAVLELSDIKFEMDAAAGDEGFDSDCLDDVDLKDFIAITFAKVSTDKRHSLFCGESLNGTELTYQVSGPIVIHVNTDRTLGDFEKGFSFKYEITPFEP